jgi:hypothetical protein
LEFGENRIGGGGPHEGTMMQVVTGDIGINFLHQFSETPIPNAHLQLPHRQHEDPASPSHQPCRARGANLGPQGLRFSANPATESLYDQILTRLTT